MLLAFAYCKATSVLRLRNFLHIFTNPVTILRANVYGEARLYPPSTDKLLPFSLIWLLLCHKKLLRFWRSVHLSIHINNDLKGLCRSEFLDFTCKGEFTVLNNMEPMSWSDKQKRLLKRRRLTFAVCKKPT